MNISILDLDAAVRVGRRFPGETFPFTHAVQILDADELPFGEWPRLAPVTRSLRLMFEDVLDGPEHFSIRSDFRGVTPAAIEALINFGRGVPSDGRLGLHCFAGRSRSTAAAMIVLAARGMAHANEIAQTVLRAKDDAHPNELMLRIADDHLQAGGRLAEAGRMIRDRPIWAEPTN